MAFQVEEKEALDRIVLFRSEARKDWFVVGFMIAFWLVWIVGWGFVATLAFTQITTGLLICFIPALIGMAVVPLALMSLYGTETIEITDDAITVLNRPAVFGKSWTCARDDLALLSLELFNRKGEPGGYQSETVITLNLVSKPGMRQMRKRLAGLVHPDLKETLFEILKRCLTLRGYSMEVRNSYKEKKAERAGQPEDAQVL